MPLPESIPVRYSDEEAGYVSLRPVVRQTFGSRELVDMVLRVAGKNPARIRQILRSGTMAYHYHRYWWTGFDAEESELAVLLENFPGADPARVLCPAECTAIVFESGGVAAHEIARLDRGPASRRRWLRRRSLWDGLLAAILAPATALHYHGYSYEWQADVFRRDISQQEAAEIAGHAATLARRELRSALSALPSARRALFHCPRANEPSAGPSGHTY